MYTRIRIPIKTVWYYTERNNVQIKRSQVTCLKDCFPEVHKEKVFERQETITF